MSNNRILFVRGEFMVIQLIVKPIAAKKANSWSMLPKSINADNKNQKNGMAIICPIKMINRYDIIEMNLNVFSCFTLIFFFVVAVFQVGWVKMRNRSQMNELIDFSLSKVGKEKNHHSLNGKMKNPYGAQSGCFPSLSSTETICS